LLLVHCSIRTLKKRKDAMADSPRVLQGEQSITSKSLLCFRSPQWRADIISVAKRQDRLTLPKPAMSGFCRLLLTIRTLPPASVRL
jgi:hypothetical protein